MKEQIKILLVDLGLGKLLALAAGFAAVTGFLAWLIRPNCPGCNRKMEPFFLKDDVLYICKKCGKVY